MICEELQLTKFE